MNECFGGARMKFEIIKYLKTFLHGMVFFLGVGTSALLAASLTQLSSHFTSGETLKATALNAIVDDITSIINQINQYPDWSVSSGDAAYAAGLQFGNSSNTTGGTIRWTGSDFEGYTGSEWKSLTGTGHQFRAFYAYKNVDQTILTGGGYQTIEWDGEAYDTDNSFSTTTNEFQPTTAGKWLLIACLNTKNNTLEIDLNKGFGVYILKNGAFESAANFTSSTAGVGNYGQGCMSKIVEADGSEDKFKVQTYTNDADGVTISPEKHITYFQGLYLGN